MKATLPYAATVALTAGAAGFFGTEHIFRLNSAYDPDFSGVGNYPVGFSILNQVYNNYRVHAVDIDILWSDPSADGIIAGCMIQPSSGSFSLSTSTPQIVDKMTASDCRALNNTGMQTVRVQRRFNVWDLEGFPRDEWVANPNFASAVGTNPSATPYLRVAVACLTSATPTATAQVRLTLHVEFYNRVMLVA
jgi:hypothetical protein